MDNSKTPILGFVLIAVVLIVWMWMVTPPPQQQPKHLQTDTTMREQAVRVDTIQHAVVVPPAPTADTSKTPFGAFFSGAVAGREEIVTVETDLYTAKISTRGGVLREWILKKFKSWDGQPAELIDYDHQGDFSAMFTSVDGRLINTHDLYFSAPGVAGTTITLHGKDAYSLDLTLTASNGGELRKRLTFRNGTYDVAADFSFHGMDRVISSDEYQIVWESGLRYAEHNSVDESSFAMAYASMGSEVKEIDATKPSEVPKFEGGGSTNWVAARTKYFAVVLIADSTAQGAYLEGHRQNVANGGQKESYSIALKMPLHSTAVQSSRVTIYLGPLDFDIVKGYGRGMENIMSLGAAWIIRPIAEYIMLPVFQLLRLVIPNYGVVIIVFALIIMVVTYPLTRSQMRSMKKMQALQPMLEELKEKYKDDPQRMNQEVFGLYKEYGVNPAGGCLPIVLQMPILFALYAVLRSNIELRQASFVWWIQDLSIPDFVVHLPFTIPFLGVSAISGLAVLMGIATFIQQKQTVTDPRQKSMIYVMPVFLTLMFNGLPSGLDLYYFSFNMISIGQRLWSNKYGEQEPLKKVPQKKRKEGFMARLAKDMPKLKQ